MKILICFFSLQGTVAGQVEEKEKVCHMDDFALEDLIHPTLYPAFFLLDTDSRFVVKASDKSTDTVIKYVDGMAYRNEMKIVRKGGLVLTFRAKEGTGFMSARPEPPDTENGVIMLTEESPILSLDWFSGASHVMQGNLKLQDYSFESDDTYPLSFKIVKDKSYVYLSGRGTVTKTDGPTIRLGYKQTANDLEQCLRNGSERLRQGAAEGLGYIGNRDSVPALLLGLKDKSWQVRRNSAEALGKVGDQRALEALNSARTDEKAWVGEVAEEAYVLINLKGLDLDSGQGLESNFNVLEEAFENEPPLVRKRVVEIVGNRESDRAMSFLRERVDREENKEVKEKINEVIKEKTP